MKKLSFILILLPLILAAETQPPILTLQEAMATALQHNHQIKIARNNAAISKNNAHPGNAGLLPQLSLSAGATYLEGMDVASSTSNAKLQAGYTLYDGLGNHYLFQKLKAGGRLGEIEARSLIESTLLKVCAGYYQAASAYESLQIAVEILSISRERLERSKKRAEYGQAGGIDVLSAQVDFIADQVTEAEAKFSWDDSRRNLNVLLNRAIDQEFIVETGVEFQGEYNLENLTASAFAANADYLASGESLEQARYDLKISRAAYQPRIDLNASYGYDKTALDFNFPLSGMERSFRVGATLNFSIFDGYQKSIRKQNAWLSLKNRELGREQARLMLEKEVVSAYEAYKNSLLLLDLEKKYVEAAGLNFKRTRELYNLGHVTTTQFREAQLNLARARVNLANARYGARLKEIDMLRLTGQLVSTIPNN